MTKPLFILSWDQLQKFSGKRGCRTSIDIRLINILDEEIKSCFYADGIESIMQNQAYFPLVWKTSEGSQQKIEFADSVTTEVLHN